MEKNNKEPKKKGWFKSWGKGIGAEFDARIGSSVKRLIKFFGILLVPIIYGITCIVAFWDPVPNIGKAPIAFLDTEKPLYVATKGLEFDQFGEGGNLNPNKNIKKQKYSYELSPKFIGILANNDGTYKNTDIKIDQNEWNKKFDVIVSGKKITTTDYLGDYNVYKISSWSFFKNILLPKNDLSVSDTDYTFKTKPVSAENIAFENIHYLNGEEAKKEYKSTKYFVQVKIDDNMLANYLNLFSGVVEQKNTKEVNDDLLNKIKPLKIWTTFERNFIFGYYMNTLYNFKEAIPVQIVEKLIGELSELNPSTIAQKIVDKIKGIGENPSGLYTPTKDEKISGTSKETAKQDNEKPMKKDGKYLILDEGAKIDGTVLTNQPFIFDSLTKESFKSKTYLEDHHKGIINSILYEYVNKIETFISLTQYVPGFEEKIGSITKIIDIVKTKTPLIDTILYDYIVGENWTKDTYGVGLYTPKRVYTLMKNKIPESLKVLDPNNLKQVDLFSGGSAVEYNTELKNNLNKFLQSNNINIQGNDVSETLKQIIEKTLIMGQTFLMNNISQLVIPELINVEIQGTENGIYGIGLGQFFLLIGMYVGALMQTFVFDRAKRVHKLTAKQWYLSKTLLMLTTGVLQVTLLTMAAAIVGFSALGVLGIFKLWLWLLLTDVMFIVTIQALWFAIKDETIGKFLCVIYMVLNLSSGWGTFPSFMEFGFFNVVSYVCEFTYSLHGMGAIVYGQNNLENSLYILKQFGIMLIFIIFFITLGLLIANNRNKEMYYGSYRAKLVAECLEATNNQDILNSFRIQKNKGFKYKWANLPDEPIEEVVLKMRELHPFEGQFKHFKNKHHDRVLKPNYSDDDIISRNDDIIV